MNANFEKKEKRNNAMQNKEERELEGGKKGMRKQFETEDSDISATFRAGLFAMLTSEKTCTGLSESLSRYADVLYTRLREFINS